MGNNTCGRPLIRVITLYTTAYHFNIYILIHMVVHVLNISFTYTYTYIILIRLIMFHFISSFIYTFLLVLITVHISSHRNAMLLISCHIMSFIILKSFAYTCHLLLCFMLAYTLEVDTGKNYMYPKVLSLYETVTSICMTQTGHSIMIQTGFTSLTQTGSRYL